MFVPKLDSSFPAKRQPAVERGRRWFLQQVESLHDVNFSINLCSFRRVNIVELSFSTLVAALWTLLKANAMNSCKHTSLHENLKYLPQQPCCGLQPPRPTKLCLPLSSFRVRLFNVEIHARKEWSVKSHQRFIYFFLPLSSDFFFF